MNAADLLPRHAQRLIAAALEDTRVVLISGARQSGKSTLVRLVAGGRAAERRDLDREPDRAAAQADPTGFVAFDDLMVIDEIQRVPELMRAIKVSVDEDPRPGRFLLTGSSSLFGLRGAPDALPGRMETVELWPFSQGEIDGAPDGFIDAVFTDGPGIRHDSTVTRADYATRIVRGGLPEAVARAEGRRRGRFLDSYVQALIAQFSVAIERMQAVQSLERRVSELDLLSQVGQALNYTIEFDDLLELISTRTSGLIQSQHFYIALHDANNSQMYFAFYLQNDERYPEKEAQRWRLGNDLFSEIVRTRQPRLIDDYGAHPLTTR